MHIRYKSQNMRDTTSQGCYHGSKCKFLHIPEEMMDESMKKFPDRRGSFCGSFSGAGPPPRRMDREDRPSGWDEARRGSGRRDGRRSRSRSPVGRRGSRRSRSRSPPRRRRERDNDS